MQTRVLQCIVTLEFLERFTETAGWCQVRKLFLSVGLVSEVEIHGAMSEIFSREK